jgi:protein involved in polysaccharide export with SLBB domain
MFKWLPIGGLRVVFVAALLTASGRAFAQPASSSMLPGSGSACYVWGQVRSPGAYSFVANPDILELLSAGGGPTENADLRRVILLRAVTQKRVSINLQAMLASGQIVRLAPGDVVIVPSSAWYHVRDWISIVTVASTLATLTLTIVNRVGT